ncbi:MAG TPA: hypothetical protein VHC22_24240 [Pirellulales bacterium]|nr:hypothetical protein [Pirellulales bacterium]
MTVGTAIAIDKGADAPEPNASSEELLEAARSTYEFHKALYENGRGPTPEDLYVWSKRWMAAERDLNPAAGEVATALKAHAERMDQLEASTRARNEAGRAHGGDVTAAKYYSTEAKLMLARTGD